MRHKMSEKDRGKIMEALKDLPEDKKQFMLGYAAGVVANSGDQDKPSEKDEKRDG